MRNRRLRLSGLLCLIWIALIMIFAMQNGNGSHSLSNSITRTLASFLIPDFKSWSVNVQSEWISGMEELIRKIAHFIEFTVLGLISFPAISHLLSAGYKRTPDSAVKCGVIAFCVGAVIATASELVQIAAVNRTSTASDVLLDCAGILLGIFVAGHHLKGRMHQTADSNAAAVRHRKG